MVKVIHIVIPTTEKQKLVESKSEEIEQMKSDTQMKISKLEREV